MTFFEQGICFVHGLLDENGKILSLEKVQLKYNVHLNYLQYFQLIAAIPNHLKKNAMETAKTDRSILEEWNVHVVHLSDNKTILLIKMHCKDYYIHSSFKKRLKQNLQL